MSDYIPPELWPQILVKLPVRSAIQCTSVCKLWHSIITSSTFISNHLSLSLHHHSHSHNQNPLLLTPPPRKSHNTFSLRLDADADDNQKQEPLTTLRFPFPTLLNGPFRLVGSVHGLVLLSDDLRGYTDLTVLWNPSIRRFLTLPRPRFTFPDSDSMLGFGFDSSSADHKVVRLVYLQDAHGRRAPPLVELYSLRHRSWRTVTSSSSSGLDCWPDERCWTQCFIHGAVHWIGSSNNNLDNVNVNVVLLFDVEREEFRKMALPENATVESIWDYFVSVVGGLLSVCVCHGTCTNVWVRRDYCVDSWTRVAVVDEDWMRVGEWLDLRRVCGDCRDIQVSHRDISGEEFLDDFVFSYAESLVLLDGDNAVREVSESLEKTRVGTLISLIYSDWNGDMVPRIRSFVCFAVLVSILMTCLNLVQLSISSEPSV